MCVGWWMRLVSAKRTTHRPACFSVVRHHHRCPHHLYTHIHTLTHIQIQVADALLSDEASTPEVLFFAAKVLQTKIYYDFRELPPQQ